MTDAQTTFAKATLEYDTEHEKALLEAITEAIFEASRVRDRNAVEIRTGEAAEALLTVLAGILAISPVATRSPTAIRRTIDDLGKRLRRQIAAAEQNADIQEFVVRRTFDGNGTGMRRILPQRRRAETFDLRFWNQPFTVTVGFYADGTPGEVFIDGGKTGQDIQSTARDAAVVLSLALQHGTPIETIRHAVTRGASKEPASILGAVVDSFTTKSFSGGV